MLDLIVISPLFEALFISETRRQLRVGRTIDSYPADCRVNGLHVILNNLDLEAQFPEKNSHYVESRSPFVSPAVAGANPLISPRTPWS